MARKNKSGKNEHSHSDKKGKTERRFFYISNLPPRPSIQLVPALIWLSCCQTPIVMQVTHEKVKYNYFHFPRVPSRAPPADQRA